MKALLVAGEQTHLKFGYKEMACLSLERGFC